MTKLPSPYRKSIHVTALSMALVAVGCSANQADTDKNTLSEIPLTQHQSMDVPTVPLSSMKKMNREEQVLFARQDLANRLSIELDEVSLSGAAQVIWRSGALGCLKPGMEYTQMLVKGALIMLRVGHTPYRYHATITGEPFFCADSQAEAPYTNSSDA